MYFALRKRAWSTRMLTTGAICVSLAFVLSCVTLFKLPQGGSVTPASMLPIMIFAYIYGPGPGMAIGALEGVLQLLQDAYVLHPIQLMLDYILPFALLGISGFFRNQRTFPLGIVVATLLRGVCHFISGWLYFGAYAPAGMLPVVYSLQYNASYILPEAAICVAIVLIPRVSAMLKHLQLQRANGS